MKLNKLFALTILTACGAAANAQTAPSAPSERQVRRIILTQPSESVYLGVQTEDIAKDNFAKYGLTAVRGVGVAKVVENSPAAKGGLRNGDVIVKFDGEDVSGVRKLTRLVGESAPDHTAKLTILRDGGEREINVTLGKRAASPFPGESFGFGNLPNLEMLPNLSRPMRIERLPDGDESSIFTFRNGATRQIGVAVAPLTKQLGEYFGIGDDNGLLISEVRENSPAAKAGLKAGDVIVQIEGREIQGIDGFSRAINDKKEGSVTLIFVRDKNRQTINLTPETVKEEKIKAGDLNKIFGDAPNRNTDN